MWYQQEENPLYYGNSETRFVETTNNQTTRGKNNK